jgi:hypothetical protein
MPNGLHAASANVDTARTIVDTSSDTTSTCAAGGSTLVTAAVGVTTSATDVAKVAVVASGRIGSGEVCTASPRTTREASAPVTVSDALETSGTCLGGEIDAGGRSLPASESDSASGSGFGMTLEGDSTGGTSGACAGAEGSGELSTGPFVSEGVVGGSLSEAPCSSVADPALPAAPVVVAVAVGRGGLEPVVSPVAAGDDALELAVDESEADVPDGDVPSSSAHAAPHP